MGSTYTYECGCCGDLNEAGGRGGMPRKYCSKWECQRERQNEHRRIRLGLDRRIATPRVPLTACLWCGTPRLPRNLIAGDCDGPLGRGELSCSQQRARVVALFPHLDFAHAGDLIFGEVA